MGNYINKKDRLTPVGVLIFLLLLSFFCYKFAHGYYSAKYTESAHGNSPSGVGVDRVGLNTPVNFGYSKGNCAHCHEQHASIGGTEPSPPGGPDKFLLFYPNNPNSQNDNFCYQCHKSTSSAQNRIGGITNYTYSKNFGGGDQTYTTIYDAFNPLLIGTASSHNLSDVLSHAVGRSIGFTNNNNACIVCHNPHTAQKNYDPVILSGIGGVKTAIRRPVDYNTQNTNLWGDEDLAHSGLNERMIDYDSRYTAPYYKGGVTFEPANNSTNDGSNLPNFVNFCTSQCHTRNDVYSSERSINLFQIDWDNTGDQHGRVHDDSGLGYTIAPYVNIATNYVLSCTDCHEPHGSTNEWLLRTCVNGKDNINVPGPYRWLDFCTACHTVSQHYSPWDSTTNCNQSGVCHQHGNLF